MGAHCRLGSRAEEALVRWAAHPHDRAGADAVARAARATRMAGADRRLERGRRARRALLHLVSAADVDRDPVSRQLAGAISEHDGRNRSAAPRGVRRLAMALSRRLSPVLRRDAVARGARIHTGATRWTGRRVPRAASRVVPVAPPPGVPRLATATQHRRQTLYRKGGWHLPGKVPASLRFCPLARTQIRRTSRRG